MEPMTHLERAVAQATRIVEGVKDDQLASPTPCEQWDVRALLAHILGGAIMFRAAATEGSVPPPVMEEITSADLIGSDFRARMRAEGAGLVEAFRNVKHDTLELPFGTMPTPAVQAIATLDATIHAADLAHATGQTFDDDELAEVSLEVGRRQEAAMGGMLRSPNVFGPEQPCADDAPAASRLLAFAGRKV